MDIANIDLNLLRVLHHLLLLKKVSAVAQHLGMSQPAVSSALGRLRTALGDELFVRAQGGMLPSPYALQLAAPLAAALDQLQQALSVREAFDPATSQRSFTIAMSDVGEMYFLPVLMDFLSQSAPGVTLQVVSVAQPSLKEDMAAGRIDLAMGLLPQLQAGFFQQALFQQKYVCLMRAQHPLAEKAQLRLSDFAQAEHVRILAAGTGHGRVDVALEQKKLQRRVRLTVPHYVALAPVLTQSDLIATVPERFADRMLEPFDLVKQDLPIAVAKSAIHQFWHERLHRDQGHQWLRRSCRTLFGDAASLSDEQASPATTAPHKPQSR
jgi:DNA-binding transcriptional LysR family regulator